MGVLNAINVLTSIGLQSDLVRWKSWSKAHVPRSTKALPSCVISSQISIYIKHELVSKLVTLLASSLLSPREL